LTIKLQGRSIMDRSRNHLSGFTLVELAVVLVILGILVLVGFPVFSESQVGAKRNTCLDRQHMIFEAALIFCADSMPADGDLSVSRLEPELIQPSGADCPAQLDGSADDYHVVIVGGAPTDVVCDVMGDTHPWDP
jgi:prepilin-type N-terminal cleavage/methylation domain-containing protein